jgi:hypothetical protein
MLKKIVAFLTTAFMTVSINAAPPRGGHSPQHREHVNPQPRNHYNPQPEHREPYNRDYGHHGHDYGYRDRDHNYGYRNRPYGYGYGYHQPRTRVYVYPYLNYGYWSGNYFLYPRGGVTYYFYNNELYGYYDVYGNWHYYDEDYNY